MTSDSSWHSAAEIVGWTYVVAWGICLYPQVIVNYKRKSVEGYSFDFPVYNTVGYLYYVAYNLALFCSKSLQEDYERHHDGDKIPVKINDVVFAVHGLFVCIFTVIQCLMYKGRSPLSTSCKSIMTLVAIAIGICFILAGVGKMTTLTALTIMGFGKMLMSLSKYLPQAFMNYKRKSTKGFSIVYAMLDVFGGTLSIAQMFFNAIGDNDWGEFYSFTGLPKLLLGLLSIFFDIVYLVQHYVLYYHASTGKSTPAEDDDGDVENAYSAVYADERADETKHLLSVNHEKGSSKGGEVYVVDAYGSTAYVDDETSFSS